MSIVAQKTSCKASVLEVMYPSLSHDVLLDIARDSTSLRHAIVRCNEITHPTFRTVSSIESLKKKPEFAKQESKFWLEDVTNPLVSGDQVPDMPHLEEFVECQEMFITDTAEWDAEFLYGSERRSLDSSAPLENGHTPHTWNRQGGVPSRVHGDADRDDDDDDGGVASPFMEPGAGFVSEAVEEYADVFDPKTKRCSMAKELRMQTGEGGATEELTHNLVNIIASSLTDSDAIPETNTTLALPLIGKVPVRIEPAKITDCAIPPEAAHLETTCDTCFRLRLRSIALNIEPIDFTYTRKGKQLSGKLHVKIKRAHLKVGMNVLVASSNANTTAEVYAARLRLKKFSVKVQMAGGGGVNAFLALGHVFVKKTIEDEVEKALVGVHAL